MNRMLKHCMAGMLLLPWGASQAIEINEDFSLDVNIGAYSDYRSRGMSQTQGDPAIQGGVTLAHSSGLYAGIWSSNVDFGYGSKTRQEIDYYVGYYWQITDDISLDLTHYKYDYPREGSLNYNETYAKFSAYGVYVGGYYADDLADNQSYLYSFVGYETTLPYDIGFDVRYGKIDFKDDTLESSSGKMRSSYNEWQIGLSKSMFNVDWSISYVDSDVSKTECYNYNGFDDICSGTVVVGVSKSF
ncbi:TorF family putative porin [Pseudomonas sp. TTU2014-080ASC]|jgi:uncharacterized protein (TIGR02001 family)|uniref:TorF family putative porin n=1 Tax=Pseudomonas sp. TTU2014-080ASC TaxID=1729724 RepID=UPI000718A105|nr:TorF family putative porin [Pseudomonas sp. TTU2014-080ASC]KRW61194.1 hypothetical protein AO726_07620 [Pseudomonas sp. TTU2014-080ASC]